MNNFSITGWDENTIKEYDDKKLTQAKVTQIYSGLLEGHSEINYQMVYTAPDTASYIGTEHFQGRVNGKQGTLVFIHKGTFEQGRVNSQFEVVAKSGTEALIGLQGTGHFTSGEGQSVEYFFDYSL